MTITLCPCESSQIAAHGFDPSTNTLAIQFKQRGKPGPIYNYTGCSKELYDEFCGAESKGKFFGSRIKNNPDLPFKRVAEPPAPEEQTA